MKRKVIRIDQSGCTGCGQCVPNCPEGAIQIIDGKARLVSDLMCDGLGACLGFCPEGAISIEEREAEPYDECRVMANIVAQGPNTIRAHLAHLRAHGEEEYLAQALAYLEAHHIDVPAEAAGQQALAQGGCPGARAMAFESRPPVAAGGSSLTHWPVQLHLISPSASHYRGAEVLLAADCVAYAVGDFHQRHLRGKTLAIACPKLDEGQQIYREKIRTLIDEARIDSLTVMIMQVPCCGGLLRLAQAAAADAQRKVAVKAMVVSVQGEVLKKEYV